MTKPKKHYQFILFDWDGTLAEAAMPEILETLEYLHEYDKQMALITSSPRVAIEGLMQSHGLKPLIDFVVSGEDVDHQKPDPESALIAMAGLHADKSRSLLVGDSSKDLGCANNAGIDSVFFYPAGQDKFHSDKELIAKYHPTHVIKEFHELKDLLVS